MNNNNLFRENGKLKNKCFMTLKEELNALRPLIGMESEEFYTRVEHIAKTYTSEEDKQQISDFMDENLNQIDKEISEMEEKCIKLQLQNVSEIISLSFIAKKYFGKTKNWLYQRINENTVNGKPCRFTKEELERFNYALKDISEKIGSLKLSY